MSDLRCKGLLAVFLCVLPCGVAAQSSANGSCTMELPSFSTNSPNIFNDRQEQDLGDALAEMFESGMRVSQPGADDQLSRIGARMLSTLPPTGIHYRFRVYDSGEINGFSLTGGRVYISRKLIAAVKNEDELAGVLAHEIGHLATHQTAIEMTRSFRIRLGVTEVGDRTDVFAKVHQFFNTPPKPNEDRVREEKDQLVADNMALYAMVQAGYAPESLAAFLDTSMVNKGKTGNWFSDVLGLTGESSQRYRSALKMIAALPAGCKGRKPVTGGAFEAWQRSEVEERMKAAATADIGDMPVKLDPPLRPSPWRIRFSPDGKTVLVQDEGSITLVDRVATKVLSQIEAPDAEAAQFTPDSTGVVFNDSNLRVERWNVTTQRREWVKELIVYDGCSQTLLSPDGKTLACVRVTPMSHPPKIGLRLIGVESGEPFFEKPGFFEVNTFASYYSEFSFALAAFSGVQMVSMMETPDGRYLLAVAGQNSIAYDLKEKHPIQLGRKLKALIQTSMAFVGSNELFMAGEPKRGDLYHGLLLSFPDGKVLKDIDIGRQSVQGVAHGENVLVAPLKDYAVGVLSLGSGALVAGNKLPAMDMWDNLTVSEDAVGGVAFRELGTSRMTHVPLPVGLLPRTRAAALSRDGAFLALSLRNRSAVWNVDTGKQISVMRPLRSSWFDDQDELWAQLPKYMDRDPFAIKMKLRANDAAGGTVANLGKYDDDGWQFHELQFLLKPMGKDTATNHHATLSVKKMETQAVAWTRDFPHEVPACWPAEDNRLVLGWDIGSDAAKEEIKAHAQLEKEIAAFKDRKKGLLIETVVPETGAPLEQVVLPEADLTQGWGDMRRAMVSGNFVLVRGEHGNTAIYRLDTGVKTGEFFGAPVDTEAKKGLIAAVNREDEVLLVDQNSGKELKRFALGSPVRLARIVAGNEDTLLIVTADQIVHRLPLQP